MTARNQGLRQKKWSDGSSSMETRKKEYKKILLLDLITCKFLNYKALRKKPFEWGLNYVMLWPKGGIYGVKCRWYETEGAYIGLNAYVIN